MSGWYWKDGTRAVTAELGSEEWKQQVLAAALRFEDEAYQVVARTELSNGTFVSTVWLGFVVFRGALFETMVFVSDANRKVLDEERYATEAEAKAGHEAMVAKWAVRQ